MSVQFKPLQLQQGLVSVLGNVRALGGSEAFALEPSYVEELTLECAREAVNVFLTSQPKHKWTSDCGRALLTWSSYIAGNQIHLSVRLGRATAWWEWCQPRWAAQRCKRLDMRGGNGIGATEGEKDTATDRVRDEGNRGSKYEGLVKEIRHQTGQWVWKRRRRDCVRVRKEESCQAAQQLMAKEAPHVNAEYEAFHHVVMVCDIFPLLSINASWTISQPVIKENLVPANCSRFPWLLCSWSLPVGVDSSYPQKHFPLSSCSLSYLYCPAMPFLQFLFLTTCL